MLFIKSPRRLRDAWNLAGTCREPCAVLHTPMGRSLKSRQTSRLKPRVPAVYLSLAFLVSSAYVAICRISKLQPVKGARGSTPSHSRKGLCRQSELLSRGAVRIVSQMPSDWNVPMHGFAPLSRRPLEGRIAARGLETPPKVVGVSAMGIGTRLRELREQKGLTQRDVERLTGIKSSYRESRLWRKKDDCNREQ